jgi:hypothetical protein
MEDKASIPPLKIHDGKFFDQKMNIPSLWEYWFILLHWDIEFWSQITCLSSQRLYSMFRESFILINLFSL